MKTLLALVLLIPSLSWGIFNKKYDCTYNSGISNDGNKAKVEGSFVLVISSFNENVEIHSAGGSIKTIEVEKKNEKVLITSEVEYKTHSRQYHIFLPLDKTVFFETKFQNLENLKEATGSCNKL